MLTPMLSGSLRLLLPFGLALSGEMAAQAESRPSFAGRSSAEWAERLAKRTQGDVTLLAKGGLAALPVVRALLADIDAKSGPPAVRVCQAMGATAAPAVPELLRGLRIARSWWTRLYCAQALGAIGSRDAVVLDALVEGLQSPAAGHLRQVCSRMLWKLDPRAPDRVLSGVAAGKVAKKHAVEAFLWNPDASIGPLIAALGPADRSGPSAIRDTVTEALQRIGWRAAFRLYRAKHHDLARRVLRTGPLKHVPFIERYTAEFSDVRRPDLPFAKLQWEVGWGHGGGVTLYRAAEGKAGFRIERIRMQGPTITNKRPPYVEIHEAVLPRVLAKALTEQLVVIASLRLEKKPGLQGVGSSSGNFHARIQMQLVGAKGFREHWAGYPGSENAAERCRVEAARGVLFEAMQDADWRARKPTAADLARVRRRISEPVENQVRWVSQRLQKMAELLAAAVPGK